MRSLASGMLTLVLGLLVTGVAVSAETDRPLSADVVGRIALPPEPVAEGSTTASLAPDETCGYQSWYDPASPGYLAFGLGGTNETGPERWMGVRFEAPGIAELRGIWIRFWNDPSLLSGDIILEAWDSDGSTLSCDRETPGTRLRRLVMPSGEIVGSGWHYIAFADPTGVIWGTDVSSPNHLFVTVAFHPDPGESGVVEVLTDVSDETGCGMDPHTVIREVGPDPNWFYLGESYGSPYELLAVAHICLVECGTQSWYDPDSDNWKEYELMATPDPFWRRLGVRYDLDGSVELRGFWFWLTEYGVPSFGDIRAEVWGDNGLTQSCGLSTPGTRVHMESRNVMEMGLSPGWNYFPMTIRHPIQCADGPNSLFITMSFLNPIEPLVLLASAPTVPGCGADPHSIIRPEGSTHEWKYLGEWSADPYQSELKMVADVCPAPITFTADRTEVRLTGPAVVFEATSSIPITGWLWWFGDGATSSEPSPVHLYSAPGIYSVTLQATGEDGETYFVYRLKYIKVGSLIADFTAVPRVGVAPLTVSFTDQSAGSPTDWLWDFGDGATATVQNPTYTYAAGEYPVTLRVSRADSPIGPDADQVTFPGYIRASTTAEPNLLVSLFGLDLARPGFEKCYQLRVENSGSLATPGGEKLTLTLPLEPQCDYLSSNPAGTFVLASGGASARVEWTIESLDPSETGLYEVCLRIPEDAVSGSMLNVIADVGIIPGEYSGDNIVHESEEIRASWDPNDKFANPIGCGPDHGVDGDTRLSYSVFFENKAEATADAIYVMILDTLDATLDWNTLRLGPTSHDDVMTFDFDPDSREMMWFFDHISLPPNVNPPEGEGFVSYTITPTAGLAQGTVIPNRAHIRFDYNPWIAAPEEGSVERVILECCECPCHGDPVCDGRLDVLDVLKTVEVAFRGREAIVDPDCAHDPGGRTDVNCDGTTDVQDVVAIVHAAFRGQTGNICDPCACDPYPTGCP